MVQLFFKCYCFKYVFYNQTSNMWNGLLRFEDAFRIFKKNMHTSLKANNVHLHMDHVETVRAFLCLIDVCGHVSSYFSHV
jgi:hypothetical protein